MHKNIWKTWEPNISKTMKNSNLKLCIRLDSTLVLR